VLQCDGTRVSIGPDFTAAIWLSQLHQDAGNLVLASRSSLGGTTQPGAFVMVRLTPLLKMLLQSTTIDVDEGLRQGAVQWMPALSVWNVPPSGDSAMKYDLKIDAKEADHVFQIVLDSGSLVRSDYVPQVDRSAFRPAA
jgi:hypothetical protein